MATSRTGPFRPSPRALKAAPGARRAMVLAASPHGPWSPCSANDQATAVTPLNPAQVALISSCRL
jgi:hypothetical protein